MEVRELPSSQWPVARWATNISISAATNIYIGGNKYCNYWWQGGQQILLSAATNIAIIVGKVGNKNVSAATLSLCPISQGLPAQLIVQGQAGGKGLPATVTVQQLQQIVKSVAGGGQGQPTQQVKPPPAYLPICVVIHPIQV